MSGNFIIMPRNANLTRDTETFGTMDPYVKLNMGAQMFKTQQCKDGGKKPIWKEQFNARRSNEEMVTFQIFDKDSGSSDDFICDGSYNIKNVINKPGQQLVEIVPLTYKGKPAGSLTISFQFFPDQQNKPPQQQQFQQQPPIQYQQQYPPPQMQQQQYPPQMQQQQQYPPQQYQQQPQYPPQQQGFNQPPPQQGFNQPPPQQFQQQQPMNPYPQQQQGFNQPPMQAGFNQPPPQQQYYQQQPQQQGFNMPPGQQQFMQGQPMHPNQASKFLGKYPMIMFQKDCKKCRGTGINQKKGKSNNPCGKCYKHAGYCKKCCGSMYNIKKGEKCKKCKNGLD